MLSKIEWYIRQLFPLTYRSHFHIDTPYGNQHYFAVWNMWFGRVWNMEYLQLAE